MKSPIYPASERAERMNFSRAGTLAKRLSTWMMVPNTQEQASLTVNFPLSNTIRVPHSPPGTRVVRVTNDTAPMEASASPRNPRVPMAARSSWVLILLVAWRKKAVGQSSGCMPPPLSVTRMELKPPSVISTVMAVAPASRAFSTSSFTTEAGRSTTSPAAIWLAKAGGRTLISMAHSSFRAS